MLAVKHNKQIQITKAEKSTYLALGYDIAEVENDEIKIIEVAPEKKVAYSKYKEALDRIAELEAENKSFKKGRKGKNGEGNEGADGSENGEGGN